MGSSYLFLGLLVLSYLLAVASAADAGCPQYNFDPNDKVAGPSGWATLCPAYAVCGGPNQSPVDIPLYAPDSMIKTPINFTMKDASTAFYLNKGYTVEVLNGNSYPADLTNTNGGNYVYGGPLRGRHQLLRIHFHASSDHTINGKIYPMEMHCVTRNATSGIAVIGFLFQIGATPFPFLDVLIAGLPSIPFPATAGTITNTTLRSVMFSKLMGQLTDYITYPGSLTSPPCSEGLTWIVSTNILTLTQIQFDALKGSMKQNSRPTQRLGNRLITQYTATTTTTTTATIGSSTTRSGSSLNPSKWTPAVAAGVTAAIVAVVFIIAIIIYFVVQKRRNPPGYRAV